MQPINFTQHFKTLSNSELLMILNEPAKYNHEALQAARTELETRNLNESQVADAEQAIITTRANAEKKVQRIKEMDEKLKAGADFLSETISAGKSIDKLVNGLSIFVGLVSITSLYYSVRGAWYFTKYTHRFSIYFGLEFLMPAIGLIAAILFFKRRQLGWHLLMLYFFYNSVGLIFLVIDFFKYGSLSFDNVLFQHTSPLHLLLLIAWPVCLALVCKQNLRQVFNITASKMAATMAWCSFIVALVIFIMLTA